MSQQSRHRERGPAGVNLGLIITPMLDMSFQILAFFIMTYNPSIFEGHINGALVPPTEVVIGDSKFVPNDRPIQSSDEPDLDNTMQVIVMAIPPGAIERQRADGEPAKIYVKNKEDADRRMISDTDEKLADSLKRLEAALKSAAAANVRNSVRLECGGDLKQQYAMRIYDVCKGSGYQNVSFVAPSPERRK